MPKRLHKLCAKTLRNKCILFFILKEAKTKIESKPKEKNFLVIQGDFDNIFVDGTVEICDGVLWQRGRDIYIYFKKGSVYYTHFSIHIYNTRKIQFRRKLVTLSYNFEKCD